MNKLWNSIQIEFVKKQGKVRFEIPVVQALGPTKTNLFEYIPSLSSKTINFRYELRTDKKNRLEYN